MVTTTRQASFYGGDTGTSTEGLTTETDFSSDQVIGLEDSKTDDSLEHQGLVSYIKNRFDRSRNKRFTDEQRWLEAYRNFRGLYGPDVQFSDTEKSQAFIKITKTKVLAAHAKITDVLLAGNKFPLGVEASKVPEGIAKDVSVDPKKPDGLDGQGQGQAPQAPQIPSTIARPDLANLLGPLKTQLAPIADKLEEGPGLTPSSLTWSPAQVAARKMNDQIQDQLEESHGDKVLRSLSFEMCLFGTGVAKGPLARDKEYPKWTEDGEYQPVFKLVPDIEFVSIWDIYPDPEANNVDQCEFLIQRHKMSKTDMRALKKRPHFRAEVIEDVIKDGYNYIAPYWENTIKDYQLRQNNERFEVFEYWGNADSDFSEISDLDIPKQFKGEDQVQINVWVCNGKILRLVFNPFKPARIPFQACPYELNPYSFFGIGVAENMSDTQLLMNGFMRQAIDNTVLSGNVILEINENNLVPGQDMKLYPGKVFRTNGAPGQSIWSTKIDNHAQECLMLFDKARQLADEATGIPSYSHGQSGIQSTGRTAAGMQMLMGAADQNIKAVVRNIDDYILVPLGKAMFAFNMQFNFSKEFIGDLEVVALGTNALMRNDARTQHILQILQMTANPMDAPYVKRDYFLRELTESLDLEAEKGINDNREAGVQAMRMKELMIAQGIDPNSQQASGQTGSAPAPQGQSGPSAKVNPQAAPPGQAGYSGGGGGSQNAASANQGQ